MPNPQTNKIILKDRVEMTADGHGSYLKIFALGGETYRIPEKRNTLWDIFKNAERGEPVLTTFETFRNTDYIVKAELIKEKILQQAVRNLATKIADTQTEERNRSQSIAYAKDLVNGKAIEFADMYTEAEKIYQFIKGG